jgi:cobalt-precorrin-6B (C15)-methyltransferase
MTAKMWKYKTPGIPDEMFIQSDAVPGPTKEEIRILTIAKARLREGAVVADVGCGTGGLTVEAAFQVGSRGKVFAFDEDAEAVELTKRNVAKFGVQDDVEVARGVAPNVLADLPALDAVLIGGSRLLRQVLQAAMGKLKAEGRVVVNAILLETACTALDEVRKLGFRDVDVSQVFVAKGRAVGAGTMMLARNPITIIAATKGR